MNLAGAKVETKTDKKNTKPGFLENPEACVFDLRSNYPLKLLQCGEAYYSVYATNNTESMSH